MWLTGDLILQNAGSSAIAQLIAQIATARKLRVVTILSSPRPEADLLRETLKHLGSDAVVDSDYAASDYFQRLIEDEPDFSLVIDGIGAAQGSLVSGLAPDAPLVRYGRAVARPPVRTSNITTFDLNEFLAKARPETLQVLMKAMLGTLWDTTDDFVCDVCTG